MCGPVVENLAPEQEECWNEVHCEKRQQWRVGNESENSVVDLMSEDSLAIVLVLRLTGYASLIQSLLTTA